MTFEWTPDHIKTLIALWNEGHTTSEIGARMGITKNAVVGKVHRLGLPKRGSPIKPKPEKKTNVVSMAQLRPGMCVWPTGDPATDDFHFCGQPAGTGKSYCTYHARMAFQPPQRREPVRRPAASQIAQRRAAG